MTPYFICKTQEEYWHQLSAFIRAKNYSKIAIVSDEKVYRFFGNELFSFLSKKITTCSVILQSGEENKTFSAAQYCWERMDEEKLDRHSLLIGLGGGMITDIAGYVAACFMRGIDVLYIPTTLIGMVDAALGGKTGVNFQNRKNQIGIINQPSLVLIYLNYLQTLPEREFRSGLAEVIKYAISFDEKFVQFLQKNMKMILQRNEEGLFTIIKKSCEIKTRIVEKDEKGIAERNLLNWGHTFGHALESATQYSQYLHGEAIAIGMSCAALLSKHLGHVDASFIGVQEELLHSAGLSTTFPKIPFEHIVDLMKNDKKASHSNMSFILAKGIGHLFQDTVSEKDVYDALCKRVLK